MSGAVSGPPTSSPGPASPPDPPDPDDLDRHPDDHTLGLSRRRGLVLALIVVGAVALMYVLVPQIAGLEETWQRLDDGSPLWLGVAAALTIGMFGGYALGFHVVYREARLRASESLTICLAAVAANRLFAAGGAGGLVLQAWALRRRGMAPARVADRTISFLVLQYGMYVLAVIVFGYGLYFGLLPGAAPWAITFVPATIGVVLGVVVIAIGVLPPNLQRQMSDWAARESDSRVRRLLARAAVLPATASAGIRDAARHVRAGDLSVLGAFLFWASQIAALAACFAAFGDAPAIAVLVVGFFVGMLGNLLPLPGGIGGVDGGMFGAFAAFGADLGTVAVAILAFRAFTFWLPTIPGAFAYLRLRRLVGEWRAEDPALSSMK